MGLLNNLDETQMTKDQQAEIEAYVYDGYRLIYDPQDAVLKVATQNPDTKVDNVAQAAVLVADRLDAARQAQDKPPYRDEVKLLGGAHLVDKIIEFVEAATKEQFSQAEKQASLEKSYQSYMEAGIKNRTIDPVQLAKAVEEVQPGVIQQKLAGVNPPPAGQQPLQGQPEQMPEQEGQAPEQPQQKPGLLTQPSPLEKFL